MCGESVWRKTSSLVGEGELCNMVLAGNNFDAHIFVLVIDLLWACGAWDDLTDREFNHSFYSTALRRLQVRVPMRIGVPLHS